MTDLISRNGKAEYIEVIPRFEEFDNRNDDCDQCPFYAEECSGDGNKRCFSADILELLKRGRNLEMDAEPVRRGRWIAASVDPADPYFRCSACRQGYDAIFSGCDEYNYCPNCGAKMNAETP